jgi:hypothetical protein
MPPIEDLIAAILASSEDELDDVLRGLLVEVGQRMSSSLGELMVQVSRETIAVDSGRLSGIEALIEGHSRGAYLGRTMAGNDVPYGEYDTAFGSLVGEEEAIYLEGFLDDINSGKYTNADGTIDVEAIEARAELYEGRLRGTANEAFANTLDPDDLVYWEYGNTVNHCGTCTDLHDNSPYKPSEIPVYPGENACECSIGCGCGLRTESGKAGF